MDGPSNIRERPGTTRGRVPDTHTRDIHTDTHIPTRSGEPHTREMVQKMPARPVSAEGLDLLLPAGPFDPVLFQL